MEKHTTCIRCGKILTGKQQKYCSDWCGNYLRKKRLKHEKWRVIHAKAKSRRIEKRLRRKIAIEQEIKRRKEA